MKVNELKKIIKDSVREAFREEMKDLLIEAIKGNKENPQPREQYIPNEFNQSKHLTPPPSNANSPDKDQIRNLFLEMQQNSGGSLGSNTPFVPRPIDTISEGSALPEGELSMEQISKLINPK